MLPQGVCLYMCACVCEGERGEEIETMTLCMCALVRDFCRNVHLVPPCVFVLVFSTCLDVLLLYFVQRCACVCVCLRLILGLSALRMHVNIKSWMHIHTHTQTHTHNYEK